VNPVSIVLPAEPGPYEIRYVGSSPRSVLASVPYQVTAITASIEGPASIAPDSRFDVAWTGPNKGGDFVTIVAADAAPRAYGSYVDARSGQTDKTGRSVATLRAPAKSGRYELRYVQQGSQVIGTRPIEVTATASTSVPIGTSSPAPPATMPAASPPILTTNTNTPVGTGGSGATIAATWTGSARCQLAANGQAPKYANGTTYTEQITHIWTITGGPRKSTGTSEVYDAMWSVTGEGRNTGQVTPQPPMPTQNYQGTWRSDVPPTSTTLTIGTDNGRLTITAPRAPLTSAADAGTGIVGYASAYSGGSFKCIGNIQCAALPISNIRFAIEEWSFPKIEAKAGSTTVSGSSSSTPKQISPVQPNWAGGTDSIAATASCTWNFALVGGK
jgi:hypothetical protein